MKKPAIICVDDEKIVIVSLKEQLKREFGSDFIIETAESGDEALEIFDDLSSEKVEVQLIISDQIMPGMKGDELLIQIHERNPKIYKILLTGQADVQAVGNAINKANLYRYISKPWEKADLTLTVSEAIRSYNQGEKLEEQSRNLKKLNEAYNRFVPHEFLKLLNKKDIMEVQLGDHVEIEMSILFTDIRDFTSLSEQMTPEENFEFINSFLRDAGPVISKHKGFIDKYIGDSIMALFPQSANDALNAAIEMKKHLIKYNESHIKLNQQPIRIGIGIHTGKLMLGTVGEKNRMDGTVISDAVNLASRIESLCKRYGTSLIISEQTFGRLENSEDYIFRILDQVTVKGKKNSVSLFEVFDGDPPELLDLNKSTRKDFESGLFSFIDKDFNKAQKFFQKVLKVNTNDTAAKLYFNKCEYYLKHGLPPVWDVANTLDYK